MRGRLVQLAAARHLGQREPLVGVGGEQLEHRHRPLGAGGRDVPCRQPAPPVPGRCAAGGRQVRVSGCARSLSSSASSPPAPARPSASGAAAARARCCACPPASVLRRGRASDPHPDLRLACAGRRRYPPIRCPSLPSPPASSPGCRAHRGRGRPNAGVVVDADGVTVVDTLMTPDQYEPFAAEVEAIGPADAAGRAHRQQRRAGRRHRPAQAGRRLRQPAGQRPPRPAAQRRQLAGPVPRRRRPLRRRRHPAGEPRRGERRPAHAGGDASWPPAAR